MEVKPNPYRPGAGHSPPFLAGREDEIERFQKCLTQTEITKNVILTGLRGVGKTVLMDDKFKPIAQAAGWGWVGSDFSETAFLTEDNLCTRLITDLSVFSSSLLVASRPSTLGFHTVEQEQRTLSYDFLLTYFEACPGLTTDKLKAVLELVWETAQKKGVKGIVFAYDEAQLVADHKETDQYPLAVLLETFQSIQRRGARYLLLLTGLPTLFPRLVDSRTYAERMFQVQEIGRLSDGFSRQAIQVPLKDYDWGFSETAVKRTIEVSDGYPYFIQFICREAFDYSTANPGQTTIPIDPIIRKLDSDFFAGRWDTLTDRQRDLLYCIAQINEGTGEFTIPEIVESSQQLAERIKAFVRGDVSQVLPRLIDKGLIYKNRYGKYSFAVPLFGRFINRKYHSPEVQRQLFEAF
jgi:hypothetical protein